MRIVGITIVKNEEDIIESFIRYNMKVLDQIFLVDNGSTDGTLNIIKSMIHEGFAINLTQKTGEFDQIEIMNELLSTVIDGEYITLADFIIPLDADEFLVSTGLNINPREIISELPRDQLYMIRWKNYIPESTEHIYCFVPFAMSICRSDEFEEVEKILIPAAIVHEGFVMINGNHDAYAPYNIIRCKCNQLRIAHYPIRNQYQFILKNVLGYYNRMSTKSYVKGRSRHIENAYYDIKVGARDMLSLMVDYARNYCLSYIPVDAIQKDDMPFQWCGDIQLRYNHLRKNHFLQLLLSDIELIVERYREILLRDQLDMKEENTTMSETERAIEQYSFTKMRLERVKRDYYRNKSELLQMWINAQTAGYDCDELLGKLMIGPTLIFGDFPSCFKYRNRMDVYLINIECSTYNNDFSLNSLLSDVPWPEIEVVIICDTTRIEELLSIVKRQSVDKVIVLKEYLDKYR